MTTILAVDTSGPFCSLAIHASGSWLEDTQAVERLHNQVVLAHLEALAERAGVARDGFELIGFAAGPGSFTGVRIAAAVAQGVAYASGARVVPVPSSLALAQSALAGTAPEGAAVLNAPRTVLVTVTRSRRDAFYVAEFDPAAGRGGTAARVRDDYLHLGSAAPALPDAAVGVGDRPPWWPDQHSFLDDRRIHPIILGQLAHAAHQRGESLDPERALPVYVSGDSPWQPMPQ